jgi:uncharacterized membrane protein
MAIEGTGQNRAPSGDGALAKFGESLATGLGWFSLGLGLAALAMPGGLARLIGLDDGPTTRRTLQGIGLREITSGAGILIQTRPIGWVWSRVAGDAMDLALLGKALISDGTQKARLGAATAAVAGVTALDVLCGERLGGGTGGPIHVVKAITIGRPAEELYRFWHDFENLPRFMQHLEAVRTTADKRSHWQVKAPLGRIVEWDAEITEDQPNRLIAWHSLPGADVANSGSVRFEPAPGNRGTIVRVDLNYEPPAGPVGAAFAKLFGKAPDQQIHRDLRRFKQIIEVGEIVQSDATVKGWGAAQPSAANGRLDGPQSRGGTAK